MSTPPDAIAAPGDPRQVVGVSEPLDPLGDVEQNTPKNRARVGSVRPNALLYTSGIGATVDLPHLAVMPAGLDAWDPIYRRRASYPVVAEARLLDAVRLMLGPQVTELRQPPWQSAEPGERHGPTDLGVPSVVFPQWMRCTGCDLLARVGASDFTYENTNPFRPDKAAFVHQQCPGRLGRSKTSTARGGRRTPRRNAVPTRYLIACSHGHLDEFPYIEWVHHAAGNSWSCSDGVTNPKLEMIEWRSNLGPEVQIRCRNCDARRGMKEATAAGAAKKLPACRGRHPHLGTFEECPVETRLMLLGAANQWFPATIGLLVMPQKIERTASEVAEQLEGLPPNVISSAGTREALVAFRLLAGQYGFALDETDDDTLWAALEILKGNTKPPPTSAVSGYDPLALLQPEWGVLRRPEDFQKVSERSDFKVRDAGPAPLLQPSIAQVTAVDRLKKVNAFVGFTRIDPIDRVGDAPRRVAPLTIDGKPTWVPATEDRGEGVFLRFDEEIVGAWEQTVEQSGDWARHRDAHRRNFKRRLSATAADVDPDDRFVPPRYWALHTFAHLLIREMAMDSGYGSASLTERIYAWQATADRDPAAGVLISTTAPDSEGTLGGLVELSKPERITELTGRALDRAERCSSDPICAHRSPRGQEDFLHGAACHFCAFVSETSCERANRFLDRRFVLDIGGSSFGLLQSVLDSWRS